MAQQYVLDEESAQRWQAVVAKGFSRVDEKGNFPLNERLDLTAIRVEGWTKETWNKLCQRPLETRELVFEPHMAVWVPEVSKGPNQTLFLIDDLVWTMVEPQEGRFYLQDVKGVM